MNHLNIETAAEQLRLAEQSRVACEPIRDIIGADNLESAYRVQQLNADRRMAAGERLVGCKIGLTAVAVQQQFGIDQPDYGVLFESMLVANGDTLAWGEAMQPRVECEIAFVLKGDLKSTNLSLEDVAKAIDYAHPSIEIAGSRVKDWNIRIADTIADNASASHFVLGTSHKKLSEFNRLSCAMTLRRNGEIVSTGTGAACLGDPLIAVKWLAQTMAKLGRPLLKGQTVMSGALGPMVAGNPGDHFEAEIEGLGVVSVRFGS
jgi:2-keto-4-pentenoate hydratase